MSASLFAQAMREFFHHHGAWPAAYYEERLAKVYSKILDPGDRAVDVGAHSGFHATRILDCIGPSGHLICVEPLPEIFSQLQENLKGPSDNVTFFNGVLSNENNSNISFQRAVGLPGESGLKERARYGVPGTKTETLSVQSKRLDDIVSDHNALKYIKIDTEGESLPYFLQDNAQCAI